LAAAAEMLNARKKATAIDIRNRTPPSLRLTEPRIKIAMTGD
jgi:hypothetical protein